jgi:hypothetical protein
MHPTVTSIDSRVQTQRKHMLHCGKIKNLDSFVIIADEQSNLSRVFRNMDAIVNGATNSCGSHPEP